MTFHLHLLLHLVNRCQVVIPNHHILIQIRLVFSNILQVYFVLIFCILFLKVLSKISLPNTKKENKMCNSNITIAPKPMNASQKNPKLRILPVPIKPAFKEAVSSITNNALINCKY